MKPIEAYSLEELLTVLHAYGLSSMPDTIAASNHHIYFRQLTTRQNVGHFFEEDSSIYFKITQNPTAERRVAFIFKERSQQMAVIICYKGLKLDQLRQRTPLKHSLVKSSPDNAYHSAVVYAIAPTKKSKAYLRGLLSALTCPCIYHVLDKPNSILLAESIQKKTMS